MIKRWLSKIELPQFSTSGPYARRQRIVWMVLPLLLILTCMYSLISGAVNIHPAQFFVELNNPESLVNRVVLDLRLPRLFTGLLVGMCLAASGVILQGMMKNPLADPGIVGVTSGAGLAATAIMIVFINQISLLPVASFLGALVTSLIIYALAWKRGASPERIILAGVAMNAMLGAVSSGLMLLYSDRVQSVLPWMAGTLGNAGWQHVQLITPYAVVALTLAMFSLRSLRLMRLGEDIATLLGHRVERSRFLLIVLAALLAGIAVSVAGLIGFVGLVVPHMLRLLIGHDERHLMPLSILGGGTLVALADTAARSWFDPIELPAGMLLAFLGGPFFLILIWKGALNRA